MTINPRRVQGALVILALLWAASSLTLASDSKSHLHDPYALLFGTIFGQDDRPLYGVKITIRWADQKKPKWEVLSNHEGEFAQRVPAGKADYVVTADIKTAKGQPKPELTIHVDNDERKDFSLHLK
ncbi:MAG: carboxypeptidase regulatory-like domain-containing protein [Acidobacteria bacterium]|nr:carboxypeptidase regulatory-like domain-containing protein [Acidobacteriota bacterium]